MRAIWLNRNESNIGNGDAHSTARKSRKRPQKRQTKWLPHFFFVRNDRYSMEKYEDCGSRWNRMKNKTQRKHAKRITPPSNRRSIDTPAQNERPISRWKDAGNLRGLPKFRETTSHSYYLMARSHISLRDLFFLCHYEEISIKFHRHQKKKRNRFFCLRG